MTAFKIKLIAILTMAIDHIGLFFFPDQIAFRVVGRLAFPLFAWLIANGAYHTRNIHAYLLRILCLAIVSQIPFMLANRHLDPHFSSLNVLFTLSLGLAAILVIKQTQYKILHVLTVMVCALAANFFSTDYGAMGVLAIIVFYAFFKNIKLLIISSVLLFTIPYLEAIKQLNFRGYIEVIGLFSLFFIALYNQKEGRKMKYLFYFFYPLQYVVIYIVQLLLSK
jgi:hypothetical protein